MQFKSKQERLAIVSQRRHAIQEFAEEMDILGMNTPIKFLKNPIENGLAIGKMLSRVNEPLPTMDVYRVWVSDYARTEDLLRRLHVVAGGSRGGYLPEFLSRTPAGKVSVNWILLLTQVWKIVKIVIQLVEAFKKEESAK